jgi:ribosomal protein L24
MRAGDAVFLFSRSGTFMGTRGRVTEATPDGAYVRVEGESRPMWFKTAEIVTERESVQNIGGAE